MNWKSLTSAGKAVHVNLDHVTYLTTEDGRTRVHLCIAIGGGEARHSTIMVDETPAAIIGEA